MKTYYDLTKKERKEYSKEFKKTPVGKELLMVNVALGIAMILIVALDFVCSYSLPEYNSVGGPLMITFWIIFGIGTVYELFININFTAWLKNKHDIKRW